MALLSIALADLEQDAGQVDGAVPEVENGQAEGAGAEVAAGEGGGDPAGPEEAPDIPPADGDEGAGEKPAKGSDGGETVDVERAEFEVLVEVAGVLGSPEGRALRVATDRWTELKVVEAVAHGSVVDKGAVLIRFDTRRLEEAIADIERELPGKEEALVFAQAELERLRATEVGDLAVARRTCEETKADHAYYLATARPQKLKEAVQRLKRATEFLEYEEEELKQLMMMYEADDLTEETEEIILKRQRHRVENAGDSLERARIAHDLTVETTVPRLDREQSLKRERADIELALAEVAIPHARQAKNRELTAAGYALEKQKKNLAELRGDLESLLGFRAPVAGMVVHGAVENGKAATASRLGEKLQPRGKVSPDEVLMTLVDQRPTVLYLELDEKALAHLREGTQGVAKLEGTAGQRVGVKLAQLDPVPGVGGKYAGVAEILGDELPAAMRPGRSAKVVFQVFFDEHALVLPDKAVHERIRGGRLEEIVYLPSAGESEAAVARVVETGPRDGGKVAILSGLEEGMKVLVKKP